MVQEFTPGRGPLFGSNINKPKVPIQNVVEQRFAPRPGLTPLPRQDSSKPESFFQKKKLILGVGVIFICMIVIAVVILMGGSYTEEIAEKSALFIPFMFKRK
jgi:hypothetical protein